MKNAILFFAFIFLLNTSVLAQNNSTKANGTWTSNSIWNNAAPGTSMTWGDLTVSHAVTTMGDLSLNIGSMNLSGSLTIGGDAVFSGGGQINVTGKLEVFGNLSATGSATIKISPGAQVIIHKNATFTGGSGNLVFLVGDEDDEELFADVIIYDNLKIDANLNMYENSRLAVFGEMSDTGGGDKFIVNSGGQAYIAGDITFSNASNTITNDNPANQGLYVGGTVNRPVGGGGYADEESMEVNNPDFFAWISGIPNGPLPLDLLTFTAFIQSSRPLLQWTTSHEKDFSHFEIERADQTLQFAIIGSVQGKGGNGLETFYSFIDQDVLGDRSYYRLKMIDLDGSFSYSSVVSVNNSSDEVRDVEVRNVRVSPNPVVSATFILKQQPPSGTLAMVDQTGKILWTESIKIDKDYEYTLPETIPTGVYILKIQSGSLVETQRLAVLK